VSFRLRWLTIHRFRDVRPETTLRFNDGWNVLLGQNATGKTSLLNLISMALRGDFVALAEESFAVSYELEGEGEDHVRVHLEHIGASRTGTPELRVGEFKVGAQTRGTIESHIAGDSMRLSIPEDVGPGSPMLRAELRPMLATFHSPASPAVMRFRDVWMGCYRFDEALGMFRNVHGIEDDAIGLPGTFTAVANIASGALHFYLGFNPNAAFYTVEPSFASPRAIVGDFSACPNLARAIEALGARNLVATWSVDNVSATPDSRTLTLRPPTFLLQRADGSAVSTNQLSFGQKRLFAFAWYLDANSGPLVADELVNGMHYAWIEDCVRAMEGRQVFLTAQNPLILDHVGVAGPEEVSSRFILCRKEIGDNGRRVWAWSNPTEAQSAAFFEGYENGILQVHEILRTEGLW
jgi:AAA domain/AAA domain, putative AbiEii toxin, Type IV TA system